MITIVIASRTTSRKAEGATMAINNTWSVGAPDTSPAADVGARGFVLDVIVLKEVLNVTCELSDFVTVVVVVSFSMGVWEGEELGCTGDDVVFGLVGIEVGSIGGAFRTATVDREVMAAAEVVLGQGGGVARIAGQLYVTAADSNNMNYNPQIDRVIT